MYYKIQTYNGVHVQSYILHIHIPRVRTHCTNDSLTLASEFISFCRRNIVCLVLLAVIRTITDFCTSVGSLFTFFFFAIPMIFPRVVGDENYSSFGGVLRRIMRSKKLCRECEMKIMFGFMLEYGLVYVFVLK